METAELNSPAFWESGTHHVARDPRNPMADAGLATWLESRFTETGICAFRTSGSEGSPKWVLLRKAAFRISADAVNAHFGVTPGDAWLIGLPEHHVGGFSIHARAWRSGSAVHRFERKWEPSAFVQTVLDQGITLTSLVPAQVHDLVSAGLAAPPKLRAIAVGGGGMSQSLASRARTLGWPVFQSYGMTEAASQIATQPMDSADPTRLEVLPHWQLSTDENQRLIVRGPALALGYARFHRDAWEFEPIDSETGLATRDRVQLDAHHGRVWLTFLGREREWVKILGELVHLAPIQSRIHQIAAELGWSSPPFVVALSDSRADSKLVLALEAGHPAPNELLARYHQEATSIERIPEHRRVAAFPRSHLGKIQWSELIALLSGTDKASPLA